jgi:hypothetical protein
MQKGSDGTELTSRTRDTLKNKQAEMAVYSQGSANHRL